MVEKKMGGMSEEANPFSHAGTDHFTKDGDEDMNAILSQSDFNLSGETAEDRFWNAVLKGEKSPSDFTPEDMEILGFGRDPVDGAHTFRGKRLKVLTPEEAWIELETALEEEGCPELVSQFCSERFGVTDKAELDDTQLEQLFHLVRNALIFEWGLRRLAQPQ